MALDREAYSKGGEIERGTRRDPARRYDRRRNGDRIRVGFAMGFTDHGWIGGVNNLTDLIYGVWSVPDRRIEPVVLASPDTPAALLARLPPVEIIRTRLVHTGSRRHFVRRITKRGIGCDPLMELCLHQHNIRVLSHSESLGARTRTPTIGFIADFGYRHVPGIFEASAIKAKDAALRRVCRDHTAILLHSHHARKQLEELIPEASRKSVVLYVVSTLHMASEANISEGEVRQRYGIEGAFLYLPNQFWVHKNHGIVVDALSVLKLRGQRIVVVSTGLTEDQRQPAYFNKLMQRVQELGVGGQFKVLGVVPYHDVLALMRGAVAVVNPSMFEGWGLSVAEAKSMGKTLILSDLPVFREQAPEHGHFFPPHSAEVLADTITLVSARYCKAEDLDRQRRARDVLSKRVQRFGGRYEEIVFRTLDAHRERLNGGPAEYGSRQEYNSILDRE